MTALSRDTTVYNGASREALGAFMAAPKGLRLERAQAIRQYGTRAYLLAVCAYETLGRRRCTVDVREREVLGRAHNPVSPGAVPGPATQAATYAGSPYGQAPPGFGNIGDYDL